MDEDREKSKKVTSSLFLACLCIAAVCFGVFAYLALTKPAPEEVNPRVVTISKIIVMTGILFLVLAFGHLLPVLISHKKRDLGEGGEYAMSEIFDEKRMRQQFAQYLPAGETVRAGIHAIAKESTVRGIFSGCILDDLTLFPSERGETIKVQKSKQSTYDVYIGITSYYLLIVECEEYMHLYDFEADIGSRAVAVTEVREETSLKDLGICYPLDEIQRCEVKKGWMGSIKCNLTMKNGDTFKLLLPKLGGLGGGMPHHTQYRDQIIACLSARRP